MIDRAVAAGVAARWVTADAVYGSDYHFRATAEGLGLGYVVGVRSDFAVWAGGGQVRMPAVLAAVPPDGWARVSCGDGTKGAREYDWALRPVNAPEPETYARWVLIRRSVSDPSDVTYFACGGPPATTLAELVRVAGTRWALEDLFELAKGDCGLDEYEVRSWTGWHRHVTLSLWALAVVAVMRSRVPLPRRKTGARG
jgi:SRSO17 transposase